MSLLLHEGKASIAQKSLSSEKKFSSNISFGEFSPGCQASGSSLSVELAFVGGKHSSSSNKSNRLKSPSSIVFLSLLIGNASLLFNWISFWRKSWKRGTSGTLKSPNGKSSVNVDYEIMILE